MIGLDGWKMEKFRLINWCLVEFCEVHEMVVRNGGIIDGGE